MLRRSFAFIILTAAAVIGAAAQTPEPPPNVFSFFSSGSGSYLGVQTEEVTKENFSKYGLSEVRGVAVVKVMDGSPAAAAGLEAGDIITSFNGDAVTSTQKLSRLVSEVAPDHRVSLKVMRGGSERELTATVGKRPMPKFENGAFGMAMPPSPGTAPLPKMPDLPELPPAGDWNQFPMAPKAPGGDTLVWRSGSSRQIGIGISPLTEQLAEHFGVAAGSLLINNVRSDSPAEKAGLKAGDLITEVDGKPLGGNVDLIRAIAAKDKGSIALTIVRSGNKQVINVTPEEVKGMPATMFGFPGSGTEGGVRLAVPRAPMAPIAPARLGELFSSGTIL